VTNQSGLGGDTAVRGSQRAVFISYASDDTDAVARICSSLRAASIEVWYDKSDLRGGDAWDAAIRQQIKACAVFMPVISSNSQARSEGYFRLEWKLAVDRSYLMAHDKAFLLPVVIDDTSDRDARVPDRFREVQWTPLPDRVTPSALVERVSRLLGPDVQLTPTAAGRRANAARSVASGPKVLPARNRAVLVFAAAVVIALGYLALERLVLSKRGAQSGLMSASTVPAISTRPLAQLPRFIALMRQLGLST
jgi:hypothetical protein